MRDSKAEELTILSMNKELKLLQRDQLFRLFPNILHLRTKTNKNSELIISLSDNTLNHFFPKLKTINEIPIK